MARKLLKSISKIIEDAETNKITIFTNNLKIDGLVFEPEGKCEECHENFMILQDALVCRLSDYCKCDGEQCECNDYVCFKYDWLNISISDIVAFSIIR